MLAVPESVSVFLHPLRGGWCALWPSAPWEGRSGEEAPVRVSGASLTQRWLPGHVSFTGETKRNHSAKRKQASASFFACLV